MRGPYHVVNRVGQGEAGRDDRHDDEHCDKQRMRRTYRRLAINQEVNDRDKSGRKEAQGAPDAVHRGALRAVGKSGARHHAGNEREKQADMVVRIRRHPCHVHGKRHVRNRGDRQHRRYEFGQRIHQRNASGEPCDIMRPGPHSRPLQGDQVTFCGRKRGL